MDVFLIAEIGINHNGDISLAKKLIDAAKDAKFDAVKFQKRTIDQVYTEEYLDSSRESPWGNTQRDQKEGLEFSKEQYDEIDKYCKSINIKWFASAWDVEAQKFLRQYDLEYNKVASAMLGHIPLIKEIASEKRKTFISTGMATLHEIEKIVEIFKVNSCPFELLHCNSTYPMQDEDANLRCITLLKEKFNCEVGYSGHESSLLKVCIAAVTLGARTIERHITLDRTMYGSDQSSSIQTSGYVLNNFSEVIRSIPTILGKKEKVLLENELAVRKKLRIEIN